jgi:hypothetical protein
MFADDLSAIIKALNEISQQATLAHKYGPFFFAIALLVVAPFVCLAIFKRSIAGTSEARLRDKAYTDFRFYFRSAIIVGIFCVFAGVAWWFYESYRQVDRTNETVRELQNKLGVVEAAIQEKKYAIVGVIMDGIKDSDEFVPTLGGQNTVVFSRLPDSNSLFFIILSNDQIAGNMELLVSWRQYDEATRARTRVVALPIQLTVIKGQIGKYRFLFDKSVGKLQPLS